jgi:hypothetical protein
MYVHHRNLRSRTSTYVGTGLASIFGERAPCKKLADLSPRQGNLLQRNNFSAVYKTSFDFTKLGGDQLKKILPSFKHASSSVAPKISMVYTHE